MPDPVNVLLFALALLGGVFLVLLFIQHLLFKRRHEARMESMRSQTPRVDLEEAMRRVDAWERGEARKNLPSSPLFSRRPVRS